MTTEPLAAALAQRHLELLARVNADRRAHIVAELTALSFLIEKGLATPGQVAQRMQEVQRSLPAAYQEQPVSACLEILDRALSQAYGSKKPGWTPTVIRGGLDPGQSTDPDPPKT